MVDTVAKGNMRIVLASDIELIRISKLSRVMISSPKQGSEIAGFSGSACHQFQDPLVPRGP